LPILAEFLPAVPYLYIRSSLTHELTKGLKIRGAKYEKSSDMRLNPFGISFDLRSSFANTVKWEQWPIHFEPNCSTE
jgi:hypothetical protein